MFIVGAVAQALGRVMGFGIGIAWLMSRKRRVAADPKVRMRSRSAKEEKSEDESVTISSQS